MHKYIVHTCYYIHILCWRQKPKVSSSQSDRELFEGLQFKDPWHDANLVPVFEFLYSDESTQIPSNWVPTMEAFRKELLATVELSNPELVDEYNYINSSR